LNEKKNCIEWNGKKVNDNDIVIIKNKQTQKLNSQKRVKICILQREIKGYFFYPAYSE